MGLYVGAAKVDITPNHSVPMAGYPVIRTQPNGPQDHKNYVGREEKSNGEIDPVWARTVVITNDTSNVAIVSLDVCVIYSDFASEVRRRVRDQTGKDWSAIEICSTHTHSGPDFNGMSEAADTALQERMILGVVESIILAHSNKCPAIITSSVGELTGVSINRHDGNDEIDPRVPVLVARREDESFIAVIYSFACHPILAGAQNLKLYGDYPGAASRKLEQWFGDESVAVFLQGACGDINPRAFPYSRMGNIVTHAPSGSESALKIRTVKDAERLGEVLAGEVIKCVALSEQPLNGDVFIVEALSLDIPLRSPSELQVYLDQRDHDPDRVAMWRSSTHITTSVSALRAGGIIWLFMPGEPFSGLAKQLVQDVAAGEDVCVWTVGYASDYPGYLVPSTKYSENRYENAASILDASAIEILVSSVAKLGRRVKAAVN